MIRTQVQLTDAQARRLRSAAKREGVSVAEVIRRCLDQGLTRSDRKALYEQAAEVIGRFSDAQDAGDVAVSHDRYLDSEFGR